MVYTGFIFNRSKITLHPWINFITERQIKNDTEKERERKREKEINKESEREIKENIR